MMLTAISKSESLRLNNNSEKLSFTFFSLVAFFCGLPSKYVLNITGELYVTELLLPVLAILLLLSGKASQVVKQPIFWKFVFSCLAMISGYVISDLVAGTAPANYLRAWGRNALLFSDITALALMAGSDRRHIWWYLLGTAIGSLIFLKINGIPFDNYSWKMEGYGRATLMVILMLGYFMSSALTALLILLFGVFSIYMDSRSQGAIALMLAGVLWIRNANPEKLRISIKAVINIFAAGVIVMSIILIALTQTGDEYSNRRDSSNVERFGALKIGIIAIADSPFIGFGSWGEGTKKYAVMYQKETDRELRELGQSDMRHSRNFMAHSQILQGWMEGGLLAAFFFLFFGGHLIAAMKCVAIDRPLDYMTPIFIITLFGSAWNLVMSPYLGNHRLGIAMGIAIICTVKTEKYKRSG